MLAEVLGERVLIIYFQTFPLSVFHMAASGNDIARCIKGPKFDFKKNLFLFSSFFFPFSFHLVFFLIIGVLFCFFICHKILKISPSMYKPHQI